MARSLPYRIECTEKCLQAQADALSSTFFILRQTGPTAFVIKDDQRIIKVYLGDEHQCSCAQFKRDRELCKHICWLLLRRFRVPRTNPIIWQKGLVEREINELFRGLSEDDEKRNKANLNYRTKNEDGVDADCQVEQRIIAETDVCPICQEEFHDKDLPTTYCRYGCGNNVHIKCMKIWLDHQVSSGERTIKCPLCREIFGTPEQLKEELRSNGLEQSEKPSIHTGYTCRRCRVCPINGKCYKCTTCENYYLCQVCFNSNAHDEHSFDYREKSFQRWKMALREHLTAFPNALHQMLVSRELNEDDYEILLQLENVQNAAITGLPENIVKSLPYERVRENSQLLQQGEQCRICLRLYQIGERVRRLPCQHKFHIDCIDGWLLHSHSTCPIDGQLVWCASMNNEQQEIKRPSSSVVRKKKNPPPPTQSNRLSIDMGLTIRPYQIQARTHSDLTQRFRRLHMPAPLSPLILSPSIETRMPLEIDTRSQQSSFSLPNNHNNASQWRLRSQSSTLRSSSLIRDNNRQSNVNFQHDSGTSTSSFYRFIRQRRSSNTR